MSEMIVVLKPVAGAVPGDVADRVRTRFEVLAALPPRLLIVRIEARDIAGLRGFGGIAAVAETPGAVDVTPALSESERLFIEGWAARGAKSGPRVGEGRAWDAPGFEPP